MLMKDVVGVDPDSRQLVCAYLPGDRRKAVYKTFHATVEGLTIFIDWLKRLKDPIVAIEGSNGQSGPIEKALRANGLNFYSFKPIDVENERKVSLGMGKDNENDAHAAALLAIHRANSGTLERWRRVFPVDTELQGMARFDLKVQKKVNGEISDLWKLIRELSTDLYLFLNGHLEGVDQNSKILDSSGIMNLLTKQPDPSSWTNLGEKGIWEAMGSRKIRGRDKLIGLLMDVSKRVNDSGEGYAYMIGQIAGNLLRLKEQRKTIGKMIEEAAGKRPVVMNLFEKLTKTNALKGVSVVSCAKLVAEMVDIRRFVGDDNLAQYAGFGLSLSETGPKKPGKLPRMIRMSNFNHRMKNTFMQMAKSVVHWNPDHRLTGMFKGYLKRGMSYLEALKRIGRALVRMVFKAMKSGMESSATTADKPEEKEKGTRVAKLGKTRRNESASYTSDPSDMIVPRKTKVRQQK